MLTAAAVLTAVAAQVVDGTCAATASIAAAVGAIAVAVVAAGEQSSPASFGVPAVSAAPAVFAVPAVFAGLAVYAAPAVFGALAAAALAAVGVHILAHIPFVFAVPAPAATPPASESHTVSPTPADVVAPVVFSGLAVSVTHLLIVGPRESHSASFPGAHLASFVFCDFSG